jgi:hypothetical protein
MEIIKIEKLRFSDMEQRALFTTITLMNGIVRESENQKLRDMACDVSVSLNTLMCDYMEGYE